MSICGNLVNGLMKEADPTISDWAKAPTKPHYEASEVGALHIDTIIPSIDGLASEEYVDNAIAGINTVPSITTADNGKVLSVVDGTATWVTLVTQTYYTGVDEPSADLGDNGDLYLKVSE